MANVDGPKGAWPAYHLNGGEIRANPYNMAAGTTLYKGDILIINASGLVTAASGGAANSVIGVAAEYKVSPASSTATHINVYDDPNIVFTIQADNASSATLASTAKGGTADHIKASGSSTTKISGHELDTSTLNASSAAAAQFLIIDKVHTPDNAWSQTCVKVYVRFNQHHYIGGAVGV